MGRPHSRRLSRRARLAVICAGLALLAGCGSDGGDSADEAPTDVAAPSASSFPDAAGQSLRQLAGGYPPAEDIVVSPAVSVFDVGRNRFGFAVFTTAREQITDAEVAIYAAPRDGGAAVGPYPAKIESLGVEPEFESETTASDPDSGEVVYVSDVEFDEEGRWDVVALIRDGDGFTASLTPTVEVGAHPDVPDVGEPAPSVHTPTVEDVNGDLAKIDTRIPPDDMHEIDYASVLGKRPVVLSLATPALCQSRVCGPVVDIAQQVASQQASSDVAFIHMEVYEDNDPNKGLTEPMRAFALPTEPWLFVIDRDGRVATRVEGAISTTELERAVSQVAG